MAGKVKNLQFSEGVTVTAPAQNFITSSSVSVYANDAAYVSGKGGAAEAGDMYFNSTSSVLRNYSGTSWGDTGAGVPRAIETVTATTHNLDDNDDILILDASSNAITVNLHAVASARVKPYTFIVKDNSNLITLDGNGSETIRGATTFLMHTNNQSVTLIPDGSAWYVDRHFAQTPWVDDGAVTITGTTTNPTKPTTVDEDHFWWRRDGADLVARMEYYASSSSGSAAGTGDYLFTLPNGLSADTSKITAYSNVEGGPGAWIIKNKIGSASSYYDGAGGVNYTGSVVLYDATKFRIFLLSPGDQGCVGSSYQSIIVNQMCYTLELRVPISGWEE